jgi:hypothetical protein
MKTMSATVDIESFNFNPFFNVQKSIDAQQGNPTEFLFTKIRLKINRFRLTLSLIALDKAVLDINEKTEITCKAILAEADKLSKEELCEAYHELMKLMSSLEKIVDVTRNIKEVAPTAYRSMLENRNKISDCIDLIYKKVYPPFSDLSDEEVQVKMENLSHLYDL